MSIENVDLTPRPHPNVYRRVEGRTVRPSIVWPQEVYHLIPEAEVECLQGVMLPVAWLYSPPPHWESERALAFWQTRCRLREGEYTISEPPHTQAFAWYWRQKEAR